MAESSIEWTDVTWNPTVGCDKVSPGCKHCYAKTMHRRLTLMGQPKYADAFEVVKPHPPHLGLPLRWKKPRKVFVNSMSDLFHADVPNEYIAAVFGVMAATPQHTYQVLTKRAERLPEWFRWMAEHRHGGGYDGPTGAMTYALCCSPAPLPDWFTGGEGDEGEALGRAMDVEWPLPNVILGVSVENQKYADERIPHLLATPAAVRMVSYEPALGPVDFDRYLEAECWGDCACDSRFGYEPGCRRNGGDGTVTRRLDWIIVGGESGPGARPFDVAWARSTVEQCKAAGVAVFVKQMGARPFKACGCEAVEDRGRCPDCFDGTQPVSTRSKKGGDMTEWPPSLRVREFPVVPVREQDLEQRYRGLVRGVAEEQRQGPSYWTSSGKRLDASNKRQRKAKRQDTRTTVRRG